MVSLDSSFLIDLLAGDESARHHATLLDNAGKIQFITAPAAAEVLVGGYRAGGRYLDRTKSLLDALPMLPFDRESYHAAGRLAAELLSRGSPVGQSDLYIAAISLRHDQPLLTRDSAFQRIPGLSVLSY
jgi:predicted nucleic acid-binding protein